MSSIKYEQYKVFALASAPARHGAVSAKVSIMISIKYLSCSCECKVFDMMRMHVHVHMHTYSCRTAFILYTLYLTLHVHTCAALHLYLYTFYFILHIHTRAALVIAAALGGYLAVL